MRVEVLRGLNEIGGNVVEVESGGTRILLDAGAELPGTDSERSHPIDFDALLAERRYDAVFITHYHGDHMGLLEKAARELPPVYMGELAYQLYDIACAYRDAETPFAPSGGLEDGVPITVGEPTVTPVFCDHSAADSRSLIVEDGEETLLYTGDFRSHGRKSFKSYLSKLPEHVDTLIIEGTTTGREGSHHLAEYALERRMAEIMEKCEGPVFVLLSALNVDRVTTVYKAARISGRTLLMDPYIAAITMACGEHDVKIPNPAYRGVRVFLSRGVELDEHACLHKLYGPKLISRRRYATEPFAMCVRGNGSMLSLMRKLDEIKPLQGSTLIYSMWEGYKTSPSMARFITGAKGLGIEVVSAHTSGHADETALRAVIDRTNPRRIVPIHTENAEWFMRNYPEKCSSGDE